MRAVIHNIHSQVLDTLRKLDRQPDAILSLDSHLDLSLGGDDRVYPKELRAIARRTGAHTAFRRMLGDGARKRLIVAIPGRMVEKHANDIESNLPLALREPDPGESVASVVEFLRYERGVEIFQSPPRRLLDLVPRMKKAGPWVLDVDVDCMEEMQRECYTRIISRERGFLQSMKSVVEFIDRSTPETITISEAKVSAMLDGKSNFARFVGRLKDSGYEVVESGVTLDDAQVTRGISVCLEFYRTVSRKLLKKHTQEMTRGDYEGFLLDEEAQAKEFFKSRGYRY